MFIFQKFNVLFPNSLQSTYSPLKENVLINKALVLRKSDVGVFGFFEAKVVMWR